MSRLERIEAARTLEELWACIPKPVNCTGACWDSCGPIGYSQAEGERMEAAGHRPANVHERRRGDHGMCSALTAERRCAVYEARPTICRMWGVSQVMPCDHGDCFTPLPLDEAETSAVMAKSWQIGGHAPGEVEQITAERANLMATVARARVAPNPRAR